MLRRLLAGASAFFLKRRMNMKNRIRFFLPLKAHLRVAAAVLLILPVLLLGACSSDPEPQSVTPDESAPTAAPTSPDPTLDEAMLRGEKADAALFTGSWVSYPNGNKITYTFDDDGCAIFLNDEGEGSEYHFEIEDDRIVMTSGEKRRVYIWSPRAVTFIADYQYGEAANITELIREQIRDFGGYMYVRDDYLYIGRLCMCLKERLESDDDDSIVGSWAGADGDTVTFTADGGYHYRDQGLDYDGTYEIDRDADRLILSLPGTDDSVLTGSAWSVKGRLLRLGKHYYFRNIDE